MLIKFSVKNFRSIKEEMVLDMTKTNIQDLDNSTIKTINDLELLKVAAIYGANGAGKSNLIEAMNTVFNILGDDDFEYQHNKFEKSDSFNFCYSNTKKEPTDFEFDFISENKEYRYGYSIFEDKIIKEYAYIKNNDEYNVIFEKSIEHNILNLGDEFESVRNQITKASSNIHLLNFIYTFFSFDDIISIKFWFIKMSTISPLLEMYNDNKYITHNFKMYQQFSQIFQFDNNFEKDLIKGFDNTVEDIIFDVNENNLINEIYFVRNINGTTFKTPFGIESSGTKKMFYLATVFKLSFYANVPLVVDELDESLHPLLLRLIIKMYRDNKVSTNAQLISTFHDVTILDKAFLRRDEIWFVEKNEKLETELYSLYEVKSPNGYKVRNDATYYKDYLMGYYGGVPDLKELMPNGN